MRERPETEWKKHEPLSLGDRLQYAMKELEAYPAIGKYKPSFLGMGGEHIVFETQGNSNVIAKIITSEGAQIILYNQGEGLPPHAIDEGTQKEIERRMQNDEERFQKLQKYFPDYTLNEWQVVMQLPMTNTLAKMVFVTSVSALGDKESYTIPARVRFQERIPKEAEGPKAVDIKFRYLEKMPIVPGVYERLHGVLDGEIRGEEYLSSFEEGEALIKILRENDGAKHAVREFVKRAIQYSEETGEALDLAGSHNVILFPNAKGVWSIILPDGLYPQENLWSDAQRIAESYTKNSELSPEDANRLMNGVNYARTINALADLVGIKERLHLSRGTIPGTAIELRYAILDAQSVS